MDVAFAALTLGSIYALVGVGIQLVWSALGVLNFTHGAFVMLAGFVVVTASQDWDWPMVAAVVFGIAVLCVVALMFVVAVYGPLRNRPHDAMIIGTIAAAIIIENICLGIWGPTPYTLPPMFEGQVLTVGDSVVAVNNLIVIAGTVLIIIGLYLMLQRTRLGKMLRATAQDRSTAEVLGVPVGRMTLITLGIAGALAAVAGFMVVPLITLTVALGTSLLIKGFAAAVIGGIDNLHGVIAGGFIVGGLDAAVATYLSAGYVDSVVFLIVIAMLIARPQGLFGGLVHEKL